MRYAFQGKKYENIRKNQEKGITKDQILSIKFLTEMAIAITINNHITINN